MKNYSYKWIVQRVTAIILVPLTFWFIYNSISFAKMDYNKLVQFFSSMTNSLLFLVMMISIFLHTKIGLETIIEDYIVTKKINKIFKIILNFIIYSLIFVVIFSLLKLSNF